ncbi:hypothetical protein FSP39_002032 [Pinctada imbricata]|uniref:FAS1 domain-containing protein n=1 Tax=Pinctada imbricata TaxID=66713 RepID=A0AA88YKB1_PINIB|nr:hypothetical protein FSP39_002032 [Pinctada imbricata]
MTASGSKVVTRDLEATNGIVHLIDQVMYPIPDKDIIQTCAQRPSLTQLVYSIVRANLQNDLVGGPFTVFAPLDSAFDALPTGYLNTEFLTLDKARNLIEYHYVKGTYYSVGLHDGDSVTTSQGTDVTIHINNGKVMVNNATVVEANIPVTNGVIHVIDTVLVPSKHMDLVNAVDPVGR